MKRGDLVLMVVPGDLGKPRPAVVVQSDDLGEGTTSVLVCPMSSDVRGNPHTRPVVKPSGDNGLRLASQIMTDKMLAIRRDRIRQVIGHLGAAEGDALDRAILLVLGLAR